MQALPESGAMRKKRLAAVLAVALQVFGSPGSISAAETDNWTYRFVSLEDSAPKLNGVVNATLQGLVEQANARLRSKRTDPALASDTEVELIFVQTYRDVVLRRFGDRVLPIFEACVERNDCPGWPKFERIALERAESIYGQVHYNHVAIGFLSPSIDLCGVRVGSDKLTHLFSNGFFYYNASRQKGSGLSTEQDIYRMAIADEHGLMGARSTAVVSPADAKASVAGFQLARGYFQGDDPLLARDEKGLLVKRRNVDVCTFVTQEWDEAVNVSSFTARRGKVAFNRRVEETWSDEEKRVFKEKILQRRFETVHVGLTFAYRLYLLVKYPIAYLTLPKESRRGIRAILFPRLKLEERSPIVLKHIGPWPTICGDHRRRSGPPPASPLLKPETDSRPPAGSSSPVPGRIQNPPLFIRS